MRRKTRRMLSVLTPLVMIVLACTCIPTGGQEEPRAPASVGTPPAADVLFEDDFSDQNSGWEVGDFESGSVGYKGGRYFVTSLGNADTMWGVAGRSFGDVAIEVEATQVSAPDNYNNDYGVLCREQGDGSGYYMLVSGDGYYGIAKGQDGDFEWLVEFTESGAIHQGNATNRIRAVCDGSTLALFVNGQRLATAEDGSFSEGDIGLTATSYESAPTEVHFDNLVVREPRGP